MPELTFDRVASQCESTVSTLTTLKISLFRISNYLIVSIMHVIRNSIKSIKFWQKLTVVIKFHAISESAWNLLFSIPADGILYYRLNSGTFTALELPIYRYIIRRKAPQKWRKSSRVYGFFNIVEIDVPSVKTRRSSPLFSFSRDYLIFY